MKQKDLVILVLIAAVLVFAGCSQKSPDTTIPVKSEGKGTPKEEVKETPKETPKPVAKYDEDTAKLFKALEKFKPEDDFRFEPEFEALKKKAQEFAAKKDKEFIENLFISAEYGPPIEKKAANELLSYVISDYKGDDWPDHDKYREKAIEVVTTGKDPEFRKGCWGFLTYYYEPENITPKVIAVLEKTDDKELKLEMLQNIGGPAAGCFIDKNEDALNKVCVDIIKDDHESTEMKLAAIQILTASGGKDEEVKKQLKALEDKGDDKVKEAAKTALEKLEKK